MWSGVAAVLADVNHRWAFPVLADDDVCRFPGHPVHHALHAVQWRCARSRHTLHLPLRRIGHTGVGTVFGRLTDKKGKQETFALLATALCGPLVALTLLPAWPLPVLIGVSTPALPWS